MRSKKFNTKAVVFCGVSLALAFVFSLIRLFHMPTGGSVTLFSMFFVTVCGYWFGPVYGLVSAFAYSWLQFIQNPEFLSILQVLFDYFLAFTALGISGFFRNKKNGLFTGYIAAIAGRFVFATLASYFFWSEWLPELPAAINYPFIAAMVYNGAYIFTEGLLTVIVLLLPPVRNALNKIKIIAR